MTPTRARRPSRAAWVLMVLLAWPALHVLAYVLGTTPAHLLGLAAYAAGFGLGALVLLSLFIQLLRR